MCGRKTHRQNAVGTDQPAEMTVEGRTGDYFTVNVVVPFIEDAIGELKAR